MQTPFPKGRTAFLVVHGIGEQEPFETLDNFSRGLMSYFKSEGISFRADHKLAQRRGAGGSSWTESFIRLRSATGEDWIDVHEYYWAYLTEKKIAAGEIWQWLDQTFQGLVLFSEENRELQQRYERHGRPYWTRLNHVLTLLRWFYPIAWALRAAIPAWRWLRWIREGIERWGVVILVDFIGDIAIYTTTDQKASHYQIRQRILSESQVLLEQLLADGDCDRVLIAGHSLGSVIAFDTLNRLNIQANLSTNGSVSLEKLQGLITFGSPLDKVAFFFRERAGKEQCLRRQMIDHLHSFKAKPLSFQENEYLLSNPVNKKLDRLPWVNYYNDKDPISGRLEFYEIPEENNIPLDLPQGWGVAHNGYWEHGPLYAEITRRFLRAQAAGGMKLAQPARSS